MLLVDVLKDACCERDLSLDGDESVVVTFRVLLRRTHCSLQ